jgi:hypothetical protein
MSLVDLALSAARIFCSYMVSGARLTEAFAGNVSLPACRFSSGIEFYHLAYGAGRFGECFS